MPTPDENTSFIANNIGNILDEAVEWVSKNMDPDDVFTQAQLEEWAKHNGFIEEIDE